MHSNVGAERQGNIDAVINDQRDSRLKADLGRRRGGMGRQ